MPKRDLSKEQYWRRVFRQWQRSGLTGRDFCAQHGLRESNFYAWRRELACRDQEPQAATGAARAATAPPSADGLTPVFLQLKLPASACAAVGHRSRRRQRTPAAGEPRL